MNLIKILLTIRLVLPFVLKVFKVCKDGVITRQELHEVADEIVDNLPPAGKDYVLPWGHPAANDPTKIKSRLPKDQNDSGNFPIS